MNREIRIGAKKTAEELGIGHNLIYMLHKACNIYYEFIIHTKAVKRVINGLRNIFKYYFVSLLIA